MVSAGHMTWLGSGKSEFKKVFTSHRETNYHLLSTSIKNGGNFQCRLIDLSHSKVLRIEAAKITIGYILQLV